MIKLVTFGVLCVLAVAAAACARQDRRYALFAALVILANWTLFVMPWVYNPASPAHLMKVAGYPASHENMWALADVLSLCSIGWFCRDHLWTGILLGNYLGMLSMLAVAHVNGLKYVDYSMALDAALTVQLAVILTLGGGGVSDRLSAGWHRGRRVLADLPVLGSHLARGTR
jgi:hypothetical protein